MGGHILCNNTTSANNGTAAYRDATQDNRTAADEDVILNDHRIFSQIYLTWLTGCDYGLELIMAGLRTDGMRKTVKNVDIVRN
jgi:hypothetical protein